MMRQAHSYLSCRSRLIAVVVATLTVVASVALVASAAASAASRTAPPTCPTLPQSPYPTTVDPKNPQVTFSDGRVGGTCAVRVGTKITFWARITPGASKRWAYWFEVDTFPTAGHPSLMVVRTKTQITAKPSVLVHWTWTATKRGSYAVATSAMQIDRGGITHAEKTLIVY